MSRSSLRRVLFAAGAPNLSFVTAVQQPCEWAVVPVLSYSELRGVREPYLQSSCQCGSGVPDSLSGGCLFWFGQCLSPDSVLDGCWLFSLFSILFPVSTEGVGYYRLLFWHFSGILLAQPLRVPAPPALQLQLWSSAHSQLPILRNRLPVCLFGGFQCAVS